MFERVPFLADLTMMKRTGPVVGDFFEYVDLQPGCGAGCAPRVGRVMKVVAIETGVKIHLQKFCASKDTVLGKHGAENELFSTSLCENIMLGRLGKRVQVRGPLDEVVDAGDHFTVRFSYNMNDGSFVRDRLMYVCQSKEKDTCIICTTWRHNQERVSFYVLQTFLRPRLTLLFGDGKQVLDVGTFFITTNAQFTWRRKVRTVKEPVQLLDDDRYPEAWRRVSQNARKAPLQEQFRTVCKLLSFTLRNLTNRTMINEPFAPGDVVITAQIYIRPTDVGLEQGCSFQVIETDEVCELSGCDVEELAEVHHTSQHRDIRKWLQSGVFSGLPRFHFSQKYVPSSRTLAETGPSVERPSKTVLDPVKKLKTLDLFCGCGGLTFGLEASGLADCKWAVEMDEKAAKAYGKNFPNCKVFNEDVILWFEKVKKNQQSNEQLPQPGKVDLICGGPPCQGFSRLNRYQRSDKSAEKRSTASVFFDVCLYLKPRFIIYENVAAFTKLNRGRNMQIALALLVKAGYQVRFGVLRAAAHGVPQQRQRTIILAAAMQEKLPTFPHETFHLSGIIPALTVGRLEMPAKQQGPVLYYSLGVFDAIGDLAEMPTEGTGTAPYQPSLSVLQTKLRTNSNQVTRHQEVHVMTELDRIRAGQIPQGGDWRVIPNEEVLGTDGQVIGCKIDYVGKGRNKTMCKCKRDAQGKCIRRGRVKKTTIPWCLAHTASKNSHWKGAFGRLHARKLFPTIVTQPGPLKAMGTLIHPTKDRFMSIREAARAQTFNDTFHFAGSHCEVLKQIGNAVPPVLAQAIGARILGHLRQKLV